MDNPDATALQMMVTGMLLGSMVGEENDFLDIDVTPMFDDDGNYLPEFTIKGNQSGTVLKVKVEIND